MADLKYSTLNSLFSAIADSIRAKDKSLAPINAQDMPDKIMAIPQSGGTGGIYFYSTARVDDSYDEAVSVIDIATEFNSVATGTII